MQLKILSWNIWYDGYFDEIARLLKEADADIVGLQEVVSDDPARDTIGLMKELGYEHVFAPVLKIKKDGRTMGNAVFSKRKILASKVHDISKDPYRNAVEAVIEADGAPLHVFSIHLFHTHQKPSAVQELEADNLVKALSLDRVIVMGDFNATPESAAVQKMRAVLTDTDPSDAPTWCNYAEGCDVCKLSTIDTRLDYIFTSKGLRTTNFRVLPSKGSDHLPVSVTVVMGE